jgi:hypothetical protein
MLATLFLLSLKVMSFSVVNNKAVKTDCSNGVSKLKGFINRMETLNFSVLYLALREG